MGHGGHADHLPTHRFGQGRRLVLREHDGPPASAPSLSDTGHTPDASVLVVPTARPQHFLRRLSPSAGRHQGRGRGGGGPGGGGNGRQRWSPETVRNDNHPHSPHPHPVSAILTRILSVTSVLCSSSWTSFSKCVPTQNQPPTNPPKNNKPPIGHTFAASASPQSHTPNSVRTQREPPPLGDGPSAQAHSVTRCLTSSTAHRSSLFSAVSSSRPSTRAANAPRSSSTASSLSISAPCCPFMSPLLG